MKTALLLLLLLCLPAATRAERIEYPVETLVQMSDVIVVGTLRGVSERSDGETDYGEGRIEVREVIWGGVSPGDSLLLRWSNPSNIACPRVEHGGDAGREVIWLLTVKGAEVRADYDDGFVDLSERGKVEAALKASPVVLRRDGYLFKRGAPLPITVVYRNASDSPRSFPGVASEGGLLRLGRGSALVVNRSEVGGPKRAALSDRVVNEREAAALVVEARAERRVEFDLRGMLAEEPKEGESFVVSLRPGGLPATNELRFYVGGAEAARPGRTPPAGKSISLRIESAGGGMAPRTRAGLAALTALLLSPVFYKLRSARNAARPGRALQGMQTWQT